MADYNTRQRIRNFIVGLFVLVAFGAFVWMIFIFGELPIAISTMKSFEIVVKFPEATGVQQNTPVKFCGYQIGRVIQVSPPFKEPDNQGNIYHQVTVTIAIDKKYSDIPRSADFRLMKRGLGSSYIELFVDPTQPVTDVLKNEDILHGTTGMTSEFFPREIQQKLEDLVDSLSLLIKNTNDIIGDDANKANIKTSLANVTAASAQVTETLKSLQKFSDAGTENLNTLAERINSICTEVNQLLTKINSGPGTAAKLVNDPRLYENLLDSSRELQMALEQLKILASEAREKGIKIKW